MRSRKPAGGRASRDKRACEGSGANITMQEVARLAGVSAMTVSRALKSEAAVSPQTRGRILEIVKQTGYVPDATARMFASGRSGFVAALVPSINNSNFADTTHGMSVAFERAGLQMLLGDTGYSIDREEHLVGALLQRRPEAMVLTGGMHTARARKMLAGADIPIVETWDLPKSPLGHVVGFSNAAAGRATVHYLYGRGYRRIGFIGATTNRDARGSERRAGYAEAIRELGLPEGRVVSFGKPPVTMEQGGEALGLMLRSWPDIDALVCVSDLSAFGVLMECHRRAIPVPRQIAIAGFGDFDVARCSWPRLTTTAVDCLGIGERTGELVLGALRARNEGRAFPPATVVMEFKVIARETT